MWWFVIESLVGVVVEVLFDRRARGGSGSRWGRRRNKNAPPPGGARNN